MLEIKQVYQSSAKSVTQNIIHFINSVKFNIKFRKYDSKRMIKKKNKRIATLDQQIKNLGDVVNFD